MSEPSVLYLGDKPTRIWLKVETRRGGRAVSPNMTPVWEFDDTGVIKVMVAEDGLSAVVTPVGVGSANVEVTEGPPDRPKRDKAAPKSIWPHGAVSYLVHTFEVRPADGHHLTLNVGMPGENIPQAVLAQTKAA